MVSRFIVICMMVTYVIRYDNRRLLLLRFAAPVITLGGKGGSRDSLKTMSRDIPTVLFLLPFYDFVGYYAVFRSFCCRRLVRRYFDNIVLYYKKSYIDYFKLHFVNILSCKILQWSRHVIHQ